ncbi:MAG TPA: SpoIIE family protein phosphatase [Bacteroidales bacterium]|nr:SpoIIE family protein phosphatase [Bacteroidales bacterium]HPF03626.1 SpoIIE family protein phosphatase [Bacteroidales bacterium]HPJ58327.1 SpoIIE family protein phosphatase [Bacteroidales bacterium]HPR10867.1 SpoIIE family protein phosphatase [Bacteroidales bacterium]HRW84173.1 SpoIIE family protein phosphatase [Bacteroidales bacterium]
MVRKLLTILLIILSLQASGMASPGIITAMQDDLPEEWEITLRKNLKAGEEYRKLGQTAMEAEVLKTIADDYFELGIYKKAALYYEQASQKTAKDEEIILSDLYEKAGLSYFNLMLDSVSSIWYERAVTILEKTGDDQASMRCRGQLGILYSQLGYHDRALAQYEHMIAFYTPENNTRELASAYNQAGILYFRKQETGKAIELISEAIEISQRGGTDDHFLTEAWSNIAICYQNAGNEIEMLECFSKALRHATAADRTAEAARIQRIMANVYFKKGDNYHAEVYCISCIESALKSGNSDALYLCYHDYSDVLEDGNDYIKALQYYEKYLNLRDSLNYERRLAERYNEDRIAEYEAIESRIKNELAEEEIRDLELKNLRAEAERRENEINLLIKEKELDSLERERISQSLLLEREKNIARENQARVISLEQEARIQQLEIDRIAEQERLLRTENQLLETQRKQEEENARKARQIRNMAIFLVILMVIVAVMILFGLISTRKKNLKLAESKRQIELINSDLEMTNAEVIRQKEIIEQKNLSITDSIQYARRIQTAVLPPPDFIDNWGIENFILFKPKDIVSGDFYWGANKNGRLYLAAADCTGHGVPGAFMSMLGHAFLEEIINTKETGNAATILNLLREEIINTLRQKGTAGETRDGMDISLVIIDRQAGRLDYAGANNPLYLIRGGALQKFQADHMPIGIHFISFTPFTNKNIKIETGDYLYMFSDGYADQFGGPKGRKFMYKPFQELLLKNHTLPMPEQKSILERSFEEWKDGYEQVDDVLVLGIKI